MRITSIRAASAAVLFATVLQPARADTVVGRVVDNQGTGVVGVVLTFDGNVPPGGITGTNGFFSVVVAGGRYDIGFRPPTNALAPRLLRDVDVSGTLNLGVITLRLGFVVTGTVRDTGGSPIQNVDATVIDRATGDELFTPNDNSDATGVFRVVVPAGSYDVELAPPSGFAPRRIANVSVSGAVNLGTITLRPGFDLSGTVRDTGGSAVVGADLKVVDRATGESLFTPNDNTDDNGDFRVVVPTGTHDVEIRPRRADLLVGALRANVVVSGPTSLGTIVLQPGVLVSGRVVDAGTGTPVARVDVDAEDAATGRDVVTFQDDSDALGNFGIVVPTGLFHLFFDPPRGSSFAGQQRLNVVVNGATNVGTVGLDTGFIVSGTVRGPGGTPVGGADIDFDTTPGDVRIYTPNDNTDAAGNFAVVVPAGTYRVTIEPRFASGLVGRRTGAVNITGNTTLPTFNLGAGVVLSGTITAWDGSAEEGADVDVLDPVSGQELVTPGDDSDAQGQYAVVVPTGTWNVRIQTRQASFSRVLDVPGVSVTGPTTLSRRLSEVPVWTLLLTAGIPIVGQGGPVFLLVAFWNRTAVDQPTFISVGLKDPVGGTTFILPPLPLTIPAGFASAGTTFLPLPPVNPALLGLPFRLEVRLDEPGTGAEIDRDSFKLIIQ